MVIIIYYRIERYHQDASTLESIITQTQDMLPSLRDEYAQVMKELEQEKADIAEIEGSDQDYLNELKATIAEQEYVAHCVLFSFLCQE